MINRMLQGKQPIIYGDGEQKRCFSFIGDVIDCLDEAIMHDGYNGEIFNVGPDEEFVTINVLAETIAKYLDFRLAPIYVPQRPNEVKYAMCSSDKARKYFNYSTKTSFEEGIKEMVSEMRKVGPQEFVYNYEIEIANEHTPRTWVKRLI